MTTKNTATETSAEERLRMVLAMLACPACRSALVLEDAADKIACAGCGRLFAVQDGIPVLIAETA